MNNKCSTSSYCTFVEGNLVTWSSKKQAVVVWSSAKAEFQSMTHGVCELLWLKILLAELGFPVAALMSLYCDNKEAIRTTHNPVQYNCIKHIEVDHHLIKECSNVVTFVLFLSKQEINLLAF